MLVPPLPWNSSKRPGLCPSRWSTCPHSTSRRRGLVLRFAGIQVCAAVAIATCIFGRVAGAASQCPGTATLAVIVDNQSDVQTLDVTVDGELAPDAATCDGDGEVAYGARTMTCLGSGRVECGQIAGLRPGSWIHRVHVTVPDVPEQVEQQQAQRRVLVAEAPGDATGVSNVIVWTVYPQTFT